MGSEMLHARPLCPWAVSTGPHDQGNGIGIGTEGWHGSGMVLHALAD
jgi:hypothetical protein